MNLHIDRETKTNYCHQNCDLHYDPAAKKNTTIKLTHREIVINNNVSTFTTRDV